MKNILLYPAGPAQEEAFLEAQKLGLYITTVDKDENAHCFQFSDEAYTVNPGKISEVRTFLRNYKGKLDGALLVGADIPLTQAYITEHIGSNGVTKRAAGLTIDKYAMKQTMRAAGVTVPDFFLVKSGSDIEKLFKTYNRKMVLKPNDNCGSRGLVQIWAQSDFEQSYRYSLSNVKKAGVVLEKFEDGLQISIEGIVIDGKLFVTGFADRNYDKLDVLHPYIIENGATMPTILNATDKQKVEREFEKAVHALEIHTGVVKGDMIFNGEVAFVIEVAARISGGKFASKLVPFCSGVNLLNLALRQSLQLNIEPNMLLPTKNEGVAVRYFFPPPGTLCEIRGLQDVQKEQKFVELKITYNIGDTIPHIASHPDRGGWVVCHAASRAAAVSMAESIVNFIEFIVSKE